MKTKLILLTLLWGVFSFAQSVNAIAINDTLNISKIIVHGKEVNTNNLKSHTVIVKQRETVDGKIITYTSAGIAIDSRHILTVFHAVSDTVYNPQNATNLDNYYIPSIGEPAYYATIERYDASHDLALLLIDKNAPDLIAEPMTFAKSVKIGETVFTIGHPDTSYKLTIGNISGLHAKGWNNIASVELEAKIRPGNSGGGVIDVNGDLVGMVFSGAQFIGNIGYIISAEDIQNFIKEG